MTHGAVAHLFVTAMSQAGGRRGCGLGTHRIMQANTSHPYRLQGRLLWRRQMVLNRVEFEDLFLQGNKLLSFKLPCPNKLADLLLELGQWRISFYASGLSQQKVLFCLCHST